MSYAIGLETLKTKRQELLLEKENFLSSIDQQINEIEGAIELLSGKKVWEVDAETKYDDENPNYIKGSFEEM